MKALEARSDGSSAAKLFSASFADSSQAIGRLGGADVLWHPRLGIWGAFSKTWGKNESERDWNPFGQKPFAFASNMVVEINTPNDVADFNIQGVYAVDAGKRWLLHQGRMSIRGARITEQDFIKSTGLTPIQVSFTGDRTRGYHRVAPLDDGPAALQDGVAAFIARCAQARLSKLAGGSLSGAYKTLVDWELGLSPEQIGEFDMPARASAKARRRHGEVWRALAEELTKRGIPHSNDRLAQYGPDLFTYGSAPKLLFEIKSYPSAQDVFTAVGQLHVYERLLGSSYRKILVIPEGMGHVLRPPLKALQVVVVEYRREGNSILFDAPTLSACLAEMPAPVR